MLFHDFLNNVLKIAGPPVHGRTGKGEHAHLVLETLLSLQGGRGEAHQNHTKQCSL